MLDSSFVSGALTLFAYLGRLPTIEGNKKQDLESRFGLYGVKEGQQISRPEPVTHAL